MGIVVYVDFGSPAGYLAARRADALLAAGVPVDVRAVQTCPGLPVSGSRLSAGEQDALAARFAALALLLVAGEELPWTMPGFVPRTEAAVAAYAAVHGSPAGEDVRRLLFELYWREGVDIGNPNALREPLAGPVLRAGSDADPLRQIGYAVSFDRGPITTAAARRIAAWRDEWAQLGRPELPVVLVEGATLTGVDAVRRLGKELTYVDADPAPVLADPRRYPAIEGRPPQSWVAQIGGRWRTLYRTGGGAA